MLVRSVYFMHVSGWVDHTLCRLAMYSLDISHMTGLCCAAVLGAGDSRYVILLCVVVLSVF